MGTREFRVEDHLETPGAVAAYLDEAFATGDPAFIMAAMTDVLKCRPVSEIAEKAKVNRVSLHKALAERRDARISTMASLLDVLGCRLSVQPKTD